MPWNEPGSGGSGNKDPWGNGKRGGGQNNPDIDDIINNVRKRFGGNGGGGHPAGRFSPLLIFGVLAFIYWTTQSFYQVEEGHQSIELRFGKFHQIVGAGLQFVIWPIEEKMIFDTQQVRTVEVGYRDNSPERKEALMLTRDQNIVDVTMAVQYTIKSFEDLLFNVGDITQPDGVVRVVRSATESALREVVGGTAMDDLLTTDRAIVDSETKDLVQRILDQYQTGIQIESIEIQDAKPPLEVREAFDDVVKADQDQKTYTNQAEAYAKQISAYGTGQAERILQDAEAYRAKVVAEATGEAERFNKILEEYKKAPEITRKRIYLEGMESVLSNSSKVIIDQSSGGNNLTYLPVDKIIESQRNKNNTNDGASRDSVIPQRETRSRVTVQPQQDNSRRGGR